MSEDLPSVHNRITLDADGRITREDLLTVRFSDENEGGADRATPAE